MSGLLDTIGGMLGLPEEGDAAASIFGTNDKPPDEQPPRGELLHVRMDRLRIDEDINSRSVPVDREIDRLVLSIRRWGLINPVTVKEISGAYRGTFGADYLVIAGFRRAKACKQLGHEYLRCWVLETAKEEDDRLINLTENIARQNIRMYDAMRTVRALFEQGIHAAKIARESGIPPDRVEWYIRIWPKLSPWVKEQWKKVPYDSWEPSLQVMKRWALLSHAEQDRAWKEWSCEDDNPGDELDFDPTADHRKVRRRWVKRTPEIKKMIDKLPATELGEAKRHALLWVIGKRKEP